MSAPLPLSSSTLPVMVSPTMGFEGEVATSSWATGTSSWIWIVRVAAEVSPVGDPGTIGRASWMV